MRKQLLLLSVLLLVSAPAMAASKVTAIKPLSLNVDHGINLTLDAPATSVFIANPEIADVQVMSPTSIMIFGKRTGETSFVATDAAGHTLEQRTVRVIQDLSNLRQELARAIPGNKIRASTLPNGLVLTGEAKDASTVADAYKMAMRYLPAGGDIINRIHVSGSNQIQIRVRFAEVQRNLENSLGFNWQNLANIGGFTLGIATGNLVNATGSGAFNVNSSTGLFPRPNNTTLNAPNDVIGFQHIGKRFGIQGMIDALAQDGLITILAEPNLTAMSGETANFLAGGEFPIPIPQGNGTISIEFKNYGVSLAFTPTLIGESRVSLHVKPEVSELTSTGSIILNNITVPAIITRRAETTVEVASGQSFAIAGLLDNQQSQTVNKYPLLGDVPILGSLFRSNQFQSGQTELVIIITPYIVTPNGEQQLALPTDGLSPPSESDRLFGLRYSNSDPNARPMSGAPIAARDEPAQISSAPLAPTPEPAPVAPVATVQTAPVPPPAHRTNINLNQAKTTSRNLSPEGDAPSGPGGFILE
jgi:pilus assembly protein CpaC